MLGQMMKQPLLISAQIAHAARYHADGEIVSVETTGGLHRTNWGEVERRSRQLGSALLGLGLKQSDRVATLAWNNYRHLEAYFGVSGAGLVCHTINPRLFPEQLVYILNHAQDRVLLIDKTFLPLIAAIKDKLEHLEHVVLLSGEDAEAAEKVPGIKFYDDLVDSGNADFQWPEFDENTASSLCYTSGTTGNPKGALYSHRSTVLHSMAVALPDSLDLSARDCLMPVVPMFHVNAWGIPYAAAMVGSKMVLPGPGLDGDSLKNLINSENVTCAAGVPTLWQGLIGALKKANEKVPSLTRTVIGGSACPPSMIATFRDDYGVDTLHAWGMTEMSPVGSVSTLLHKHTQLSEEEQAAIRAKQGRPPFGVDLRIADALTFFAAEREHLEEAWAGDIIGLHNHGTIQIGDTFTEGEKIGFTGIPQAEGKASARWYDGGESEAQYVEYFRSTPPLMMCPPALYRAMPLALKRLLCFEFPCYEYKAENSDEEAAYVADGALR